MPRLDRGIQYAAYPNPIIVSGILDRPVKPGDDSLRVVSLKPQPQPGSAAR
jgi:hypothetical protein